MTTKHVWNQTDRESPMEQARRQVMTAAATLRHMRALFEESLDALYRHDDQSTLYGRALQPLSEHLNRATILVDAYEYHLARCAEAGLTPTHAASAWEASSSTGWEAEMIRAEDFGPNVLYNVDKQILAKLGLPPHDADETPSTQ